MKFHKLILNLNLKNIKNVGPTEMEIGLSYEITLHLERPGNGLILTPIGSINGIKFEPETI